MDNDGDGYKAYNAQSCPQGNDCNDSDPTINPSTIWYKDADNDGYSDGTTQTSCSQPSGYKLASALKTTSGDCDDNNASKNPADNDNDGYSTCTGDCDDSDPAIHPGAMEICDGKDNNCDGKTDETCIGQSCGNGTNMGSSANFASGNLYHSQTLLQTPNSKLRTDFTLSYNSLDTSTGPLGKGWTHNYNILLTSNTDGSLGLKQGDGNVIYFRQSGGVYYPENRSGDHSFIIKNADATYTQTIKEGITYTFNTSGKLTQIKDRNNNTTTLTYSGDDLVSITDPAGRIVNITSINGKIASITDPANRTYTFAYSGDSLITVTDPANTTWQYTYDTDGRVLTKVDPQGYATTYSYDMDGRIAQSTDPEGKTKTIAYDISNSQATVTEQDGGMWTYTYDNSLNVLLQTTDPQGSTTTYTYDSSRNLLSKTEADGSTTSYTYDANGNMTSTTDALNQTTNYTYNQYGQVTSVTAPDNTTTSYEYDTNGNLIKTIDSTGAATQYQYDAKGNIIQITDTRGQTTRLTYDSYNNLTSITDPTGATTTFTYDAAGNMTSQTDASGATTRFEYNSLNQLIKTTDPQGNVTTYAYDANGNKTSQTDANGNTTYFEYNYKGQLIKVKDALGNIIAYTYGGTGCTSCGGRTDKLTAITDAKGQTTTYEYDTLGRLIKETDPLGNSITYTYDSKGNLISKTDANGNTVTYTYDSLDRFLKKTYPDSATESFTYDSKGNIISATNSNISYTFTYDANNRIITVTDTNGRVINYEYDSLGSKTKMTTPDGSVVEYNYDNANRLTSIINGGGRTYSFQYDTAGRRTKLSLPNGATANYSYDTSGRLTSLIHKTSSGLTITNFAYTYDNVGNRLTKTSDTGTKYTYSYDAIYRLNEALSSTPGYSSNTTGKGKGISTATQQQKEFYTYDAVGNRLSSDKYSSYTYNQANQLMTNGGIYNYDKNGNLTSKTDGSTSYTYSYDYENRLTKVVKQEKDETKTVSFKYDPFGRRIEKKVEEVEDGKTETKTYSYVYDNEDIILEYDGSGNIRNRYIHGPGIDEPLAVEQKGNIYYYHADGLGSIIALTDTNGKTQQTYEYDSFGNLKNQKNKIKQPYTYTGREWDRETGLYYYRTRYYDARVGRFTQPDPLGFDGDATNLYEYSRNNPVRYTDPLGFLSYDQVKSLVGSNNLSGQSNELIICTCWKESGFNPSAQSGSSSARGLMQVTKAAAKDAGYNYNQLFDGATNIKAGSKYLKIRIQWAGGNVTNGLNGYGTGAGYATNILQCEKCLKETPCEYQKCLNMIHP